MYVLLHALRCVSKEACAKFLRRNDDALHGLAHVHLRNLATLLTRWNKGKQSLYSVYEHSETRRFRGVVGYHVSLTH